MTMDLTWEQKFAAIQGLGPSACLRMRGDGSWYVADDHIEIKRGATLTSACQAGSSPEKAVNECWQQLTDLKAGEYLVICAMTSARRAFKWNGFMWEDVKEQLK